MGLRSKEIKRSAENHGYTDCVGIPLRQEGFFTFGLNRGGAAGLFLLPFTYRYVRFIHGWFLTDNSADFFAVSIPDNMPTSPGNFK